MKFLIFLLAVFVLHTNGQPNQTEECPKTWTVLANNSRTSCQCGRSQGIIHCDVLTEQVYIRQCYCMTVSSEDDKELVVGSCFYNCWPHLDNELRHYYHLLPSEKQNVTDYICGRWNRRGQMCGSCKKGYSAPVLSYDLKCMECDTDSSVVGWVKLIASGFLPVTLFYITALIFRISANSARLNGFILFAQIVSAPPIIRSISGLQRHIQFPIINKISNIFFTLYGVWNLDFLVTTLPTFCIPGFDTLEVFIVQLVIAAYPLLLIAITYLLVELHARNVKVVVLIWKPFHKCSVRFRKQLGINTSLIDVFATFFLLSHTKFISACLDMLIITPLHGISGNVIKPVNYFFGAQINNYLWCVPIGIIAFLLLIPIALLLLYPMKCFKNCLGKSCCKGRSQLALKAFMDCFLGYFKDGTNGTRNCSYMAGYYFVVRIILWMIHALIKQDISFLPLGAVIAMISALLIALVRPYKEKYWIHNITDPIAFLLIALLLIFGISMSIHPRTQYLIFVTEASVIITLLIPLVYISVIALLSVHDAKLVKRVIKAVKRRRQPIQNSEEIQSLVVPDAVANSRDPVT